MRVRDEAKVQQIHREAVRLVAREGLDGLSMHKLARAAGVSAATLYIYFADREDLIRQVGVGSMERLIEASLAGFDPAMPFADGLRVQWRNRARYFMANPDEMEFLEALRYSRFEPEIAQQLKTSFAAVMKPFVCGAMERGELVELPIEVYWAVAFAPLYQLLKFHLKGTGLMGRRFKFTPALLEQSLQAVLRALTPAPTATAAKAAPRSDV